MTLEVLCKRCTFAGCQAAILFWVMEEYFMSFVGRAANRRFSAVFVFLLMNRLLHKDKHHENFIKVYFQRWTAKERL